MQIKVLGIDIGTAITGWSIVSKIGSGYKVLDYGVVRTGAEQPMCLRLKDIYDSIIKIIEDYGPNHLAIEDIFFFKNQKTVIKVGQARGVVILAGMNKGLEVFDYTPLQVKQSVAAYGRASKQQVQSMVKAILSLKQIPKPDDAADALAIAVCHLNTIKK
jgi:crossover junction endodeoxyribonuclease RuvC